MKTKLLFFCLAFVAILSLNSCKEEDEPAKESGLTLVFNHPENLENNPLQKIKAVLKERNTGNTISSNEVSGDQIVITVPEGTYDISVEGSLKIDDNTSVKVKGYKESVVIVGAAPSVSVDLFLDRSNSKDQDFIIQEIFFTGTVTPENKQYNGDKYIKIYNNSDTVLYADGLIIAGTQFLTTTKHDYRPNIMSEAVAVDAIIMIPGNGKEHPIKPGEFLLIADNAINHKENNTNSYDLSKANFEWFSTLGGEIDNPDVPNMENIYERFLMHNQGFQGFVIARLKTDKDSYLKNYTYHFDYDFVFNGITYPMDGDCYKIPNDWIIDAVDLSVESDFEWIVMDPSLDMGWTYCAKVSKDKNRYGKCVRRKVLTVTEDGINILKDTNNSTLDFEAEVAPSVK